MIAVLSCFVMASYELPRSPLSEAQDYVHCPAVSLSISADQIDKWIQLRQGRNKGSIVNIPLEAGLVLAQSVFDKCVQGVQEHQDPHTDQPQDDGVHVVNVQSAGYPTHKVVRSVSHPIQQRSRSAFSAKHLGDEYGVQTRTTYNYPEQHTYSSATPTYRTDQGATQWVRPSQSHDTSNLTDDTPLKRLIRQYVIEELQSSPGEQRTNQASVMAPVNTPVEVIPMPGKFSTVRKVAAPQFRSIHDEYPVRQIRSYSKQLERAYAPVSSSVSQQPTRVTNYYFSSSPQQHGYTSQKSRTYAQKGYPEYDKLPRNAQEAWDKYVSGQHSNTESL